MAAKESGPACVLQVRGCVYLLLSVCRYLLMFKFPLKLLRIVKVYLKVGSTVLSFLPPPPQVLLTLLTLQGSSLPKLFPVISSLRGRAFAVLFSSGGSSHSATGTVSVKKEHFLLPVSLVNTASACPGTVCSYNLRKNTLNS